MIKTIIKETIIIGLIILAIVLTLLIILYDYLPNNKVIPESVKYTMPKELSDVKEELGNTTIDNSKKDPVLTYEVGADDLARIQTNEVIRSRKSKSIPIIWVWSKRRRKKY